MDLLWFLVIVLLVAWGLGLGGVYHLGSSHNFIHLLLAIVVCIVIYQLVVRRRGG